MKWIKTSEQVPDIGVTVLVVSFSKKYFYLAQRTKPVPMSIDDIKEGLYYEWPGYKKDACFEWIRVDENGNSIDKHDRDSDGYGRDSLESFSHWARLEIPID